jgi:hypothetical protein
MALANKGPAKTTQAPGKPAPQTPGAKKAPTPPPRRGGQRPPITFGQARGRRGANNFLKPLDENNAGVYRVRINKVGQKWADPNVDYDGERPNPTEGAEPSFNKMDNFFVELEVVESNVAECPPGYMASWVTTDKYPDSYFQDVKGFLSAATGDSPEDITIEDWEAAYGEDQPLASIEVNVTVGWNRGKTFTPHIWAPIEAAE